MSDIANLVQDLLPLSKMRPDGFVTPVIWEYITLQEHGYNHETAVKMMEQHYHNTYGVRE